MLVRVLPVSAGKMFWSRVVTWACLLMFSGAASQGCDKTFTSASGNIRSPGYSGAYPPNLDCTYLIQQTAGFVVRLEFYQGWWWLDKEGESCLDYIQVYDGDSETGPLLGGPYCGDTRPPALFSTQNVVMIRFHSDNKTYYGNQGFNIGYTAIRKGQIYLYIYT
ncbi:hypothetical protein BaRGS_00020579 [Batillaria attramentaria]|uniref:CUB domain-containing protein n=1 Tax=Batillaria attramentaria TaxID=370345 RepID=A0ABD0KM23_9CAEN